MTRNQTAACACLALAGLALAARAADTGGEEPVLRIETEASARTVTKAEFLHRLSPAEITVYSPVYQRPMTYQGFWLDEVLNAFRIRVSREEDLVFQCADDFGASMPASDVGTQKWLVAYGEPGGWTPLPERNKPTTPGPWYVVGRDTSSYKDFPWPYQVITLKIRGDW